MNDLERAISLIRDHPVMDKTEVTRGDQQSVVALLEEHQLLAPAREIAAMELAELEDFLVNHCGED